MTTPAERSWASAAEHVELYRSTDGQVGHTWHARPHLLLTTTGRRSGREHTVPLVYVRPDGPSGPFAVLASAGGAEQHPAWFLNLATDPSAGVQVLGTRWRCTAVVADEKAAAPVWDAMTTLWQGFARYRATTRRRIPAVLLPPPG